MADGNLWSYIDSVLYKNIYNLNLYPSDKKVHNTLNNETEAYIQFQFNSIYFANYQEDKCTKKNTSAGHTCAKGSICTELFLREA